MTSICKHTQTQIYHKHKNQQRRQGLKVMIDHGILVIISCNNVYITYFDTAQYLA